MINLAGDLGFGSDVQDEPFGSEASVHLDAEGGGGAVQDKTDAIFYQRIDSIKERLDNVDEEVGKLKAVQNQLSHAVKDSDIQKLDQQVEDKTKEIKLIYDNCKKDLDIIKNENELLKEKGDSPSLRVRVNLYNMAVIKFAKSLDILNENQSTYQSNVKRLCKNRLTKLGDMEEAQADELIDNYNPRLSDVLQSGTADMVINRLESRRDAALQLERSIRELYDMFNEFAVLVQQQQELFDSIENHVNQAQVSTQKGVEELEQALVHQKKGRKCLCCIIIIAVLGLIILIAILVPSIWSGMKKA